MEFYRDKKIKVNIESTLNSDEIVNRLLPHVEPMTPWYSLRVFPEPSMKQFAGEIDNKRFRVFSKDYMQIEGYLRKYDDRIVIAMTCRDCTPGSRSPSYWMGSISNAILGMTVFLLVGIFVMKSILNFHSLTIMISIEILLLGAMVHQMVRINKGQSILLSKRVDGNINFMRKLLDAN